MKQKYLINFYDSDDYLSKIKNYNLKFDVEIKLLKILAFLYKVSFKT